MRKRFSRLPAFLTALVFFFHSLLFAAADPQNEAEIAKRQALAAKAVATASEKAKEEEELQKLRKVTFEDVLREPDNIDLNFQYAQRQIAEGDVLGASGTLERILMVNPDLPRVRLLYAVVLFRLDDYVEAERELKTLESYTMPDSLRQELRLYQKQIRLRRKKTVLGVQQSNGWGYDWNRNSVAGSKQLFFADVPLDIEAGLNRRRGDTHFLDVTSLDITHDLGFQAGHQLFGSFTYFRQDQTHVRSQNLESFQFELGGNYKNKIANLTASFSANQLFLSQEHYLRSEAWSIQADRTLLKHLNFFAAYKVEIQDYLPIFENTSANDRDGNEHSVTLGTSYELTPSMKIGTSLFYADKLARRHFEEYKRISLRPYHNWLLGRGQFLINTFDFDLDAYQGLDTSIASYHRRDHTFRYRVTYGAPLTFFLIGKILPSQLADITASFSFEYYRSCSTITNYTYSNYQYQGLLTKRLEF